MELDLAIVSDALGQTALRCRQLGGGDFASSHRVESAEGRVVFAKTHADPPPGFFTTEAAGLRWLREAGPVHVPEVLHASDSPPLLVLEWIEQSRSAQADEASFGRSLAALHQRGAESFGRSDGRTTGSQALPNTTCDTWAGFLAEQRLLPLARIARDRGSLTEGAIARIDHIAQNLNELVGPPEPPARLHGDLWAGNRVIDSFGTSWLIDPACFGGHREFDLAMMRLFGGFGPDAFAAYHEANPLADGWADRIALHQLPPLIVHAIKFGGSYGAAVERALAEYT
ncbi:MAG: fructosamine kinase family protein [Acidimicrobiales bacterium]